MSPAFRFLSMPMLLALASSTALAQSVPSPSRGELLYATHCVACHNTQMHWRNNKQATDWPSLQAEVRQWQATAKLQWSEADVTAVARYLNDTIYRYPLGDRVSLATQRRAATAR